MTLEHARYTPGEVLGEGAQGRVVRVVDRERPHLPLVAKILVGASSDLAGEFALLSRLRTPGLVRVHDFTTDDLGRIFLVEDLVEGDDPIVAVGARNEALQRLAIELAETLAALHDAGFVHGDVKPANVRVPRGKRAVLLDLGAAVSRAGLHTPAFAAPEVRAGAPPSIASDLYGLGATLWACGAAQRARPLRDAAPWVSPSLADLITVLLAEHPRDRPRSARDVLAALGRTGTITWEGGGRHLRENEAKRLLALETGDTRRRVVYVTGPSGAGKSHLVREVVTRALLAGRDARLIAPSDSEPDRLIAYLRGGDAFFTDGAGPLFVVLDELHAARLELREAVESFRCMTKLAERPIVLVCTTREAPASAGDVIALGPLDEREIDRLVDELGDERAREGGGLPGWIFAALGRVPLTRESALARIATLDDRAREVLALVATFGGIAPDRLVQSTDSGWAACFQAGLLTRERRTVRLASPHLAEDLAAALASATVSDRATELALADAALPATCLATIARSPCAPARRAELLAEAARRARQEDARSTEIEALLALVTVPAERTGERLVRLERLVRDAGKARAHPQVLGWLEESAELTLLARRRRAEERARAGDMGRARELADEALAASSSRERIYALATRGSIDLWCAEWEGAAARFAEARALAEQERDLDREELARLDHNAGVVALYRGEAEEAATAFERAVTIKRALGDRVGVRACLLNLGLALTRLERWESADAALAEATALADSLDEPLGRGWCFAARADLEIRRGRPRHAERHVAEAEAMGDVLPSAVQADLAILRAQIALAEGSGSDAMAALARLTPSIRQDDALIDARAFALEARARLSMLPVDRRAAARSAIASLRRARTAKLPEQARDAEGILRIARGRARVFSPTRSVMTLPAKPTDEALWDVLRALGSEPLEACAVALAQLIVRIARAERVLIAEIDPAGEIVRAWGVDLDGLAISEAAARIDRDSLRAARGRATALYQPAVSGTAGIGSRLAAARGRVAIVIEHRFHESAFDHVEASECERWLTVLEITLRLERAPAVEIDQTSLASSVSPIGERPRYASTKLPNRGPRREYPTVCGQSPALLRALSDLDLAVDSDLPILIEGETGTGKEVFARALHEHGARRKAPFVAVNCAAIADSLFEAELFGHARGAFTGADRARPGLLARAEGGTLLLDELGELALARQATLLRVLEEHRYRPVGSDDDRAFDVRIVAATNRDLDQAVADGTFRKDLLYRLRVLRVTIPPLRDREGDLLLLFRHFLAESGWSAEITPVALEALETYAFPGNVRELSHMAQRLAAARLSRIDVANLPREVRSSPRAVPTPVVTERNAVERALAQSGGNITHAAGILGITRHGLKKRMLRLGLRGKENAS